MTIQVNAQTNAGVWGYMITVWDGSECVASRWLHELPALPPSGAAEEPK